MKENLKTTTYRNGTPIPNVTDASSWESITTGAFVWYDNDISWKDKYGALYNWIAVRDTLTGICPIGWHVPTNNEWTELTNYIGGAVLQDGKKLKSCSQVNSPLGGNCNTAVHPRWNYAGTEIYGTDEFGFSAIPGGQREMDGGFNGFGIICRLWSSSQDSFHVDLGKTRSLYFSNNYINEGGSNKRYGLQVRCIKD
jgi:uncharacterized protein (TIGR02145 family)